MAQLASESEELHQVPGQCGPRSALRGVPLPEAFLLARLPFPWVLGIPSSLCSAPPGTGVEAQVALGPHCPLSAPAQVVSSILRNLSWRADINSKKVLREVGSMTALMQCVLRASKVGTSWRGGLGTGRPHPRPQEEGPARAVQC